MSDATKDLLRGMGTILLMMAVLGLGSALAVVPIILVGRAFGVG